MVDKVEKKSITLRSILFTAAGVLVTICMLMNWVSVDLNYGIAQLDGLLGKINPFTVCGFLNDLEENLGVLASVLPETFDQLKLWSAVMMGCAGVTIILYALGIAMRFLGKEKHIELITIAASLGVFATCVIFFTVTGDIAEGIYDMLGLGGMIPASESGLTFALKKPFTIALLGGVLSVFCTELVEGILIDIAEKVKDLVMFLCEWVKILCGNIGYVISDLAGVFAGLAVGSWVMGITDTTLLVVISGMCAMGIIAGAGCFMVSKALAHKA